MRRYLFLAALLLLTLTTACGGGGGSSPSSPTGTLTLRLGTDSFPGYQQVVVSVEKVEASPDGSNWIPLGDVKATFDLMALQNGHSAIILPTKRMNTGSFLKFRLTWATVNYQPPVIGQPPAPSAYVIPTGGSGLILAMPATTIISGLVSVSTNMDTVAQIMFSGQQAVQQRAGITPFQFQATGQAYDLAATAKITGHLSVGSSALPGVEVFAETVDGLGTATLRRRAFSDASGNYTLEALPTGNLYIVAAQPVSLTTTYAAAAAAPVDATTPATSSRDLTFSSPLPPGSLTLNINPPSGSTEGTWGELRQSLLTGSAGSATLIVRSETATTGAVQDQVSFLGLTPGIYGVTAQRSAAGATPVMKVSTSGTLVTSGGIATATLSYP
jgi:hypothetical protein